MILILSSSVSGVLVVTLFLNKSDKFNKRLLRCKDRVKHIYPKNVYELRETLFEKLEGFNLPVSEDNKLFKNLAIFDFESICVPTGELKKTQTTTWIRKHAPISVSISSNLIDEPIFLYNKEPQNLIIDFVSKLELLAEKSKLEMRTKFQDFEVAVIERMKKIFDQLNERGKNIQVTNSSKKTNALKIRKKQICQNNFCEFRKINSSI